MPQQQSVAYLATAGGRAELIAQFGATDGVVVLTEKLPNHLPPASDLRAFLHLLEWQSVAPSGQWLPVDTPADARAWLKFGDRTPPPSPPPPVPAHRTAERRAWFMHQGTDLLLGSHRDTQERWHHPVAYRRAKIERGPLIDPRRTAEDNLRWFASQAGSHPNLAQILDVMVKPGPLPRVFSVSVYYAGGSLDPTAAVGCWGWVGTLHVLRGACEGLRHLHEELMMLHGNVRPDTIRVDLTGHGLPIGVIDGLEGVLPLTLTGHDIEHYRRGGRAHDGAVGYGGAVFEPADPRRDQVALVVTCVEVLAGVPWPAFCTKQVHEDPKTYAAFRGDPQGFGRMPDTPEHPLGEAERRLYGLFDRYVTHLEQLFRPGGFLPVPPFLLDCLRSMGKVATAPFGVGTQTLSRAWGSPAECHAGLVNALAEWMETLDQPG